MEIIGRVTNDVSVNFTNTNKEVVNFSVAVNFSYKLKGATEYIQTTTLKAKFLRQDNHSRRT